MRLRQLLFTLVVVGLFSASLQLHAQDVTQDEQRPLLIQGRDQVWAWNISEESFQPLVLPNAQFRLVPSPHENRIAAVVWDQITYDAIERTGGFGGGRLPGNIHVFDLETGTDQVIASQPADARFYEDGTPANNNAIIRSDPVWSPDGTMLIWTEQLIPDENRGASLVLYDVSTGQTSVLARSLPPGEFTGDPPEVLVTDDTIITRTYQPANEEFPRVAYPFGIEGTVYTPFALPPLADTTPIFMFTLEYDGRVQLATYYGNNEYGVFDPQTGEGVHFIGTLELLPEVSDTPAASFRFNEDGTATVQARGGEFEIDASAPESLMAWQWIAPPPDGNLLAILDDHAHVVTLWQNGVLLSQSQVALPAEDRARGIFWGGARWRFQAEGDVEPLALIPVNACETDSAPELEIGGEGRVFGSPNNLREAPARDGRLLGQIPAGATFTVIAGPECNDGITWWQVEYGGIQAWTAASSGSIFFVEPVAPGGE